MLSLILCFNWPQTLDPTRQSQHTQFPCNIILPKDHTCKYKAHIMDSGLSEGPQQKIRVLLPATSQLLTRTAKLCLRHYSSRKTEYRGLFCYTLSRPSSTVTHCCFNWMLTRCWRWHQPQGPQPAQISEWQALPRPIHSWWCFNKRFFSCRIPFKSDSSKSLTTTLRARLSSNSAS